MLAVLERDGELGILRVDNPPVNALSPELVAAIDTAFAEFEADASLRGLVIEAAGRTFVAGGDIKSFDAPDFSAVRFNALLGRIEACERPVGAALFGTALGGGLEFAMACHIRIANPATKLGLPEIKLGILPGSLGTQRLPRLAGVEIALGMISDGEPVSAAFGLTHGIIDAVAEDHDAAARAAVRKAIASGKSPRRASTLAVPDIDRLPSVLARARAAAAERPWLLALGQIAPCLEAAARLDFAAGEKVEADAFAMLRPSAQSRGQRHIFFAERAAARGPDGADKAKPRVARTFAIAGEQAPYAALIEGARKAGVELVAAASADIVLVADAAVPSGNAVEITWDADAPVDHLSTLTALIKRAGMTSVVTGGDVGTRMLAALGKATDALRARGVPSALIEHVKTSVDGLGVGAAPELERPDVESVMTDAEIREFLLAALVNEGAALLETGRAFRASDIDILMVRGYGFPHWRGGPLFMADEAGLPQLVRVLDSAGADVSAFLREVSAGGQRLSAWRRQG